MLGGCHFASDAAARIDADDEISSAFEKLMPYGLHQVLLL